MKKIAIVFAVVFSLAFVGCNKTEEMILLNENELLTTNEVPQIDNNNESMALDSETIQEPSFVVFVCGEVNNPGVYEIESDGRLIDAIEAAGGYTDNAAVELLNLAKSLSDGEKIYVPSNDEVLASKESDSPLEFALDNGLSGGTDISGGASKKININKATEEELMTLTGIGAAKAKAIIAYREENGGFNKIEDLMNIRGIKDGMFNKVKDNICVK